MDGGKGANIEPLIGVTACRKEIGDHPFHAVGDKYVMGVVDGAGGIPVVIAAIGDRANGGHYDLPRLIERLDGLLVTGSPSNVEPHRYGGSASRPGVRHDPERDSTTLPLIRAATNAGLPLLAMCRGVQELTAGEEEAEQTGSPLGQAVVRPLWGELTRDFMHRLDDVTVEDLCVRARDSSIPRDGADRLDYTI